MKYIETYIVDSFTDKAFEGNPAGVCLLEEPLLDSQMQNIAKELGLSETAFVMPTLKTNKYTIRYFSPKMEIPLCGHATLASSKVLFNKDYDLEEISFQTIEKLDLSIKREGKYIIMEFPIYNTSSSNAPTEILLALGIRKVENSAYNSETNILLLEIEDSQELRSLEPNFEALLDSHDSLNGVLVTAKSKEKEYDFESRYFWPWSGTNEDPVTGGTHTFLAKYWGDKLHKSKMNSFQCSERSGFMEVELISRSKLLIKSQAQIVFEGKLRLQS